MMKRRKVEEKEKEKEEEEIKALRELDHALEASDADRVTRVLQTGAITPQALDKGDYGVFDVITPLTQAIRCDHSLSVLDQLIAAGAKVETRDPLWKVTPLAVAVYQERPAHVDHLLHRHGADPNATMTSEDCFGL